MKGLQSFKKNGVDPCLVKRRLACHYNSWCVEPEA